MNKERFLRLYVKASILIGFLLLVSMFAYVLSFPGEFNGLITKTIFNVTFETYEGTVSLFNTPLIIFVTLFLVNVFLLIRIGNVKEVENKHLQEVMVYNTLFSFMLIVGQIVFFIMIPDRINGHVRDLFVFVEMPLRTDEIMNVINVNYIVSFVYIAYNIFVSMKNIPEKVEVEVEDEELYEEEVFKELEQNKE